MHISVFSATCNLRKDHIEFPESINAGGGTEDTVTLVFFGIPKVLERNWPSQKLLRLKFGWPIDFSTF